MSAPWSSGRVLALREFPTAAPDLRFAVRFVGASVDGPAGGSAEGAAGGSAEGADRDGLHHDADLVHPLAGTGKLFLAAAVARLAEREPGLLSAPLLEAPLTIRGEHRAVARSGTFRRMSGELQLTVDDAMALIVGTGDGACVAALLELLEAREADVLAEARRAVAELGLEATTLTGLETSAPVRDVDGGGEGVGGGEGDRGAESDHAWESWGEGLLGTTTPADLCALLVGLVGAASAASVAPTANSGTGDGGTRGSSAASSCGTTALSPTAASTVLRWMGMTFEPAGLASTLPGFGPRTIPHRTVSGLELSTPAGAPGCASVLILPADVGTGRPTACVAAYQPRTRADGSAVPSREISAVLGSLGLATAASRG